MLVAAGADIIRVRNVFSSGGYSWDEIERFEIDAAGGAFPTVCRIYTTDGRVRRAFGVQENNIALAKPAAQRPAAQMVAELNELLARSRAASVPS